MSYFNTKLDDFEKFLNNKKLNIQEGARPSLQYS